jgi:hypothetical protein
VLASLKLGVSSKWTVLEPMRYDARMLMEDDKGKHRELRTRLTCFDVD